MHKKHISMVLVCVLCFAAAMPVYAQSSDSFASQAPERMTGILTDDNGDQFVIEGTLVSLTKKESLSRLGNGDVGYSATYMYSLPAYRDAGGSNTVYDNDGAIASTVYLTVDYLSRTNNNVVAYLLTEVSGYWVVTNSQTTVTSASIDYVCEGLPNMGSQPAVYNVPVQNYFCVETGFTKYVDAISGNLIGAHLTVNYRMGSSRTWSFTLSNLLFQDV